MSDLNSFGNRMNKLGQTIQDNADKLVRKTALAIDATVVLATPVDTGRARGNWQVGLDNPLTETTELLSPSGREAIEAGAVEINKYKGDQNSAIFISNNLPYIQRLNEGWSAQAPEGFVEEAVIVGVDAIRKSKIVDGNIP